MKLTKNQIAWTVLSTALVYDVYVARKNKRINRQLNEHIEELEILTKKQLLQIMYIADMCVKNDIPIDEFDAIVLMNLTQED